MFSSEEEGHIDAVLNGYLQGQTKKLLEKFNILLSPRVKVGDELESTTLILTHFGAYNPLEELLVPHVLSYGYDRKTANNIDSRMKDMVHSDYPWFWGMFETLNTIKNVQLAINLEGEPDPGMEMDYGELLAILFEETRTKNEKGKWLYAVGQSLQPISGQESDYKVFTQLEFIIKFMEVIDKLFPANE